MAVSEDCKLITDWMREPDHAEKFTFTYLNDWLDRRPVAEVARLTAALSDQVVVPKEPTPEMLLAGRKADEDCDMPGQVYRAMIAAALLQNLPGNEKS